MGIGVRIPDSVHSPERPIFRLQGPVRLQQHDPANDIERSTLPASLYRADQETDVVLVLVLLAPLRVLLALEAVDVILSPVDRQTRKPSSLSLAERKLEPLYRLWPSSRRDHFPPNLPSRHRMWTAQNYPG